MTPPARHFPLWLKISYTAFVLFLIPVYWRMNGAANFLWFSDIALFVTCVALWKENRLLASAMALELVWNLDFFGQLLAGRELFGLASYMFDPAEPRIVKILSFTFHVGLPIVLVAFLLKKGYDRRALPLQTLVAWLVLPLTYAVSGPDQNINWVYGLWGEEQRSLQPIVYLGLLMLAYPLIVYLPSHAVFVCIEKRRRARHEARRRF